MKRNFRLTYYFFALSIGVLLAVAGQAQTFALSGKVTNTSLEPMRYVSVYIKELKLGAQTDAQGRFSFNVEEGRYDVVFTMVGFKPQLITLVVRGRNTEQNVILEEERKRGDDAVVFSIRKDRWEEIMKNVIRNKENYLNATSTYTCNVYLRATQENEKTIFKKKNPADTVPPAENPNAATPQMNSMAEVVLQLDRGPGDKIKETRNGVKVRGNAENLFYLTTTDGDFGLYNNLIKIHGVADLPMLSPVSNAGLNAYKFKTTRLKKRDGRKFYTLTFSPVKSGNALIEGELEVMDSLWVITSARYTFPNYLMNEYDYFGVEQQYTPTDSAFWMLNRQELTYISKTGRTKNTGRTVGVFTQYKLDPAFSKRYFNNELSATTDAAYEQDSSFWEQVRQEPLTPEQLAFIRTSDSIQRAQSTQEYMDSVDKEFNRITLSKLFVNGQGFYNRKNQRSLFLGPILGMIKPVQFGGMRIGLDYNYYKTYGSRKNVSVWGQIDYGFRNRDIKGDLRVNKMYNPFNRGYYGFHIGRVFDNIFSGDSWVNQLSRSRIFEKDVIDAEHGLEIANGLFLTNKIEFSQRRSADFYNISNQSRSYLWGLIKIDSQDRPISFPTYNAFFNTIGLSYTPAQKYIREPREKVILGSRWPTFSVTWRKGIRKVLQSEIDFDYLEFKVQQKLKLGLAGVSQYTFTTGEFINKKNLPSVDYKFIRAGDPLIFINPSENFQVMDSTFAVFNRFYEFHYLHNFNGSIINRLHFMKKLRIQEVVGAGFLIAPERNLRYVEAFAGLEKNFKFLRDRYKVGVYVVFSTANQFNNPVRLKLGFQQFNRRKNSWY
jgi:hypothetical protein